MARTAGDRRGTLKRPVARLSVGAAGALLALGWLTVIATSALLALGWLADPAAAHAALIDTSPSEAEVVEGGPDEVVLVFNEAMQPPATIDVSDPEGEPVTDGDPEIDGQRVRVALPPLDADGTYTVEWRAVSADDHPLDGAFTFEVTDTASDDERADEAATAEDAADAGTAEDAADAGTAEEADDDRVDDPADEEADEAAQVATAAEAEPSGPGIVPVLVGAAVLVGVLGTVAATWAQRRGTT